MINLIMGLRNKVEFSVEGFLDSLEKLTKETKILNNLENEKDFFENVYPKLEELYYTVRAKGIMKRYVKD